MIPDDGIQYNHPDLKQNYDPHASKDINDGDDDPMPQVDDSDDVNDDEDDSVDDDDSDDDDSVDDGDINGGDGDDSGAAPGAATTFLNCGSAHQTDCGSRVCEWITTWSCVEVWLCGLPGPGMPLQ